MLSKIVEIDGDYFALPPQELLGEVGISGPVVMRCGGDGVIIENDAEPPGPKGG